MQLTENAAKSARFYLKLCDCFAGTDGVATQALDCDADTPREFTLNTFRTYCLMASGAQWIRDSNGDWQLVEANDVETETAVRELIDYLGVPFVGTDETVEQGVNPAILATLFEFGVSLQVEGFKYSTETKGSQGDACGSSSGKQQCSKPENTQCHTSRNSPNLFSRIFYTFKKYI